MPEHESHEVLEAQAKAIIDEKGSDGIAIQLYVLMRNDIGHLKDAVGEIKGILYVLVPLSIASIVFTGVTALT